MPLDFTPFNQRQLKETLFAIHEAIYRHVADLDITAWRTAEPVPYAQRISGEELHLHIGDSWGKLFDCAWFRFRGQVPPAAAGQPVAALLDVNGELCVFDQAGAPLRGLTSVSSSFDLTLGMPGKNVLPLIDAARGDEVVEIWADAGANDLFGELPENGAIKQAHLAILHADVRDLYYDFEVLLDSLTVIPPSTARHQQILEALNRAVHLLWNGITPESTQAARQALAPALNQRGGDPSLRISGRGHAHIDLAWLWPERETHRKGARTFATVMRNMERYPDYVFSASQAQLFQWIKDQHPSLYEQIRRRVAERRFEPQGALWVECDTNLTGGESLIRQILYGRRFFQTEFGVDPNYVWLPDTFGYSGALPQILKRSGTPYFSTQKLSWSLINRFPYHSFHWQGIDGSSVLVHMLPEETYNSSAAPSAIGRIEENYAERGVSQDAMLIYGIGDGGGGPGEEHLERLERLHNFAGLPPVFQEWTADFFPRWAENAHRFPAWAGELYLERHQGTLTTNARNKRFNRLMEQALRELEFTSTVAQSLSLAQPPRERLEAIWKDVLLFQFHDILPGSSIKRVYDETLARYQALYEETQALIVEQRKTIDASLPTTGFIKPAVVFNSLSWERAGWLKHNDNWLYAAVPAMGYSVLETADSTPVIEAPTATPTSLENEFLRAAFDEKGELTSLYNKQLGREAIPPGETGNRLRVFRDTGDAWDFAMNYYEFEPVPLPFISASARVDGPRAVVEQVYRLNHSELKLEISLSAGNPRLEFSAQLHWREPETMLRVYFPVAVLAEEASYEIQFGHIKRPTHTNTSWDKARDEVPGQKWADLSQRDFGLALLNDSKYGHRIKGHTIELNLLRSAPYPGARVFDDTHLQPGEPNHVYTDQAEHTFRYALYPHADDVVAGGVTQQAYEFNYPLSILSVEPHTGSAPAQHSWLSLSNPQVVIETVKPVEDGNGTVIRLYEATRASGQTTLTLGLPARQAWETNLLEQPERELALEGSAITLDFKPFEIKTILIR